MASLLEHLILRAFHAYLVVVEALGALLVGLTANYIGFLAPKVALGSNILLMALILLWPPQGLYPVAKR